MKQNYYLLIFIFFLFATCETKLDTSKDSQATIIFKSAKLMADENQLQKIFKTENIKPYDVYRNCVENNLDFATASRFIRATYAEPNENYSKKHKLEWYLSRLPLVEFAQMLFYYKESYHKTFMDVGSGNGDKLLTALCMGFEKAYGVEYEKKLNDVAVVALKDLIEKKLIEVKEGDATKEKLEYFSKADFLYMYCPLVLNKPEQAKLLLKLLKNMRNNTIIYEAGFLYAKEFNQISPTPIADGYRGFLAIKKEKDKYYYRIFVTSWEELTLKF